MKCTALCLSEPFGNLPPPTEPHDNHGHHPSSNGPPDGNDPTPTDPSPTDPSPTDPSTPPSPELTTLTGELQPCDAGWCIDSTILDLGPDDYVEGTQAPADYNGDDKTETIADELSGLIGVEVTLQVEMSDSSAAVYTIQDLPYRPTDGSPAPWE
jgi:hypothetical protein